MKADSELIKWLLEESGLSNYNIGKRCKIHSTTIASLKSGKAEIENLSFKNASELTEYALYLTTME